MSEVAAQPSRLRAAGELLTLIAGIELLLWSGALPAPGAVRIVGALLAAAPVLLAALRARSGALPRASGAAIHAWWLAMVATVIAAIVVLAGSRAAGYWTAGTLHFDAAAFASWGDVRWWTEKLVAVALQQVLLQGVVLPACLRIAPSRAVALSLAALAFGAVHLPNPLLALLTTAIAPVWCLLFLRTGRWLPLFASHLLLAVLVRGACGDAIYNMRVGASALSMLPRDVVAADGSSRQVSPRSVEGFVDGCMRVADRVRCRGWSADVDRRQCADRVVVLAAGSWHAFAPPDRARPDVADAFGIRELGDCGFEVELPASWFEREEPRFFGVAGERIAELELHAERLLP